MSLDRDRQRLAEIEEALTETEELMEARRSVEERRAAMTALKSRQSDLEWAVDEVRGKAGDIEGRLYGGSVRNPKELTDLQADLTSLQTHMRKREDILLALLLEVDEAEAGLREAESAFKRIAGEWKKEQGKLLREKSELEPEVERLQAKRDSLASGMDRAALGLYDVLRARRGGVAVARVERGMCQGCRITLPTSVLQRARTSVGLVQCVSCERILLMN